MPGQRLDCHERALRLLAARPRSRRELSGRLLRAGFDTLEVEEELARLESVGLVDDDAFARELAKHHLDVRGSGRRAVLGALRAKGVSSETIEAALAELRGDEADRAFELARTRLGRLASLPADRAFSRLVSFLARRGYDPATARRAARAALGVDPGTEG
jgi:regulatory protein